ncbi:MAG: hypothetical protein ACI8XB_003066 [Patiriisocius sp.]
MVRRKPIAKSFANRKRIIPTFSVVKNVRATTWCKCHAGGHLHGTLTLIKSMKYTCLILWLPILLSCCNNTNNQEQSNKIKDLEERIQKLERINANIKNEEITPEVTPGVEHFIENTGGVGATIVDGIITYDGDKYIWNGKEYVDWTPDYKGSSPVLEEEKSKDEEELSSDSRYPNIENSNISSKCSWCNDDVSMIESFRNDGHNIYRLMDDGSYRVGELEILEKLLGEEDEDEFNSLKMAFAWVYGGDFYCSRKCASHHDD